MKAQMNRYGSGRAPAALAAAYTAGVSTTAVASFDRNTVTRMPTRNTRSNSRRAEPRAWRAATIASQSNRPCWRASSASTIMPIRNRYTSSPLPTAPSAACHGISPVAVSNSAAPPAQTYSGSFQGRSRMPRMARVEMPQRAREAAGKGMGSDDGNPVREALSPVRRPVGPSGRADASGFPSAAPTGSARCTWPGRAPASAAAAARASRRPTGRAGRPAG